MIADLRKICVRLSMATYSDYSYYLKLPIDELIAVIGDVADVAKSIKNKR